MSKYARYRATQEKVREALAAAYSHNKYLDRVLEEITNEMWEDLYPEIVDLLEEYDGEIDISRHPDIRLILMELEREQHWRLMEYWWIGYNVINESLIETYKQASKDAYTIVKQTPIWENPTVDASLKAKADIRITDTYITSEILPIPWCSDGKVYSQRLYGHIANFQSKLDYVLRQGVSNGRGMEWMTQAWRKLTNSSAYDTARLLKTETMAMYNRGLKDSYLEMGIEYVEIVGDAECGGICLDYVDGDPIPLEGADLGGELPPYHPNCACSFVTYEEVKQAEDLEE